ncbi:hypothetical protein N865_07665 [Intrasporangium oryzae NRRL B-24470]|uniref:O-antigen ligase-related domain-containing protein n=1 Tax=Intrasporangium oryzae NRRL B-24470 TaxID=1386089 RepID=W9GD13_9MICO|nr:O-antigen ligase family protein [Intrasporangium oryzae]EWT01754.1 hypothetical protein N865_07665 [Intrasporangium oryzae NRRL B-24470]
MTTTLPVATGAPAATRAPGAVRGLFALAVVTLPLLVPSGPGNTAPADLTIALSIVAGLMWLVGVRAGIRVPYLAGVWILMVAGAVAAFAAGELRSTLVIGQDLFLLAWSATIASCLLADRSLVEPLTSAWCWSGAVWALLLIVGRLGGLPWLAGMTAADGSRASLTFGDPNLAGNYFVVSLFFVLAARRPRGMVARCGAIALIVTAIVFTGSNGAVVGALVGGAVSLVVGLSRSRGPAVTLVVACALALGLGVGSRVVDLAALRQKAADSGPVLHDSLGRSDESSREREVLVAEGIQLFWRGDLLGVGPSRTKATLAAEAAPYVKEAHNDYVATIVERGALGGLGLVVLVTSIAVRLRRVSARGTPEDTVIPAPHFLAGIGAAFLVSGAFYEVLHFRHLWAYLGLVAGLDLLRMSATPRLLRQTSRRAGED